VCVDRMDHESILWNCFGRNWRIKIKMTKCKFVKHWCSWHFKPWNIRQKISYSHLSSVFLWNFVQNSSVKMSFRPKTSFKKLTPETVFKAVCSGIFESQHKLHGRPLW
jgi:hypothetical protein